MHGILAPQQRRDWPLWLTGGLMALALHAALAAWWLWTPAPLAVAPEPPAAMMVELADTVQAVHTQQNTITSEKVDAQASQAQNKPEMASEAAAEPTPEPHPEPLKTLLPALSRQEKALITQPAARAAERRKKRQREEQQRQQKKQQEQQQREQQASAHRVQAEVKAEQAQRTAARQTVASSTLSPQQQAGWMSRVMAHLEKRKRYPEAALARGEQGVVTVEFTLDGQGNVGSVALKASSGFTLLDNEVLALLRRASPLPPPPDGQPKRLAAPVQFFRRSAR